MAKTKKTYGDLRKAQEVDGLDRIDELANRIVLSIPKLRALPDISNLSTTERVKAVKQTAEDVAAAVKFLGDAGRKMAGCTDHIERKVVADEIEEPVAETKEYLKNVFALEDRVYRSTIATAYLRASFSQQFRSYDEAAEMLNDLVDRGLLIDADREGKIMMGYRRYNIGDFGLDTEEIAEIGDIIARFSRTLITLENQRRKVRTEAMEQSSKISLAEALLTGKKGRCLVHVPAESYIDRRDNTERWRGGGDILLDFRDKDVFPIEASGSIERIVIEMLETNIRLGRHTLEWKNPPGYDPNSRRRVVDAIMDSLGLSFADANDYLRKVQTLWHLIHRGIKCLEENKAREAIREAMSAKASITAAVFFGLNGADDKGTALLQFHGAFHQKDGPTMFEPFFLARKCEENDEEFFEIVEMPLHLQDALGQYVGQRFSTSDDFRSCPTQLGRLIRGMRGQTDMAVQTSSEEEE